MNKNLGRIKNTTNKLDKQTKEILLGGLEPHLKDLGRNLHKLDFEERLIAIRHFSKILAVGDSEIANTVKEVIWEGLKEHFNKMKFYFPHLPHSKKISELRQFMKLIPDKNQRDVIVKMIEDKIFKL